MACPSRTCASRTWGRPRSSRRWPRAQRIWPVSGRPTPMRCKKRPARPDYVRAKTAAPWFPAPSSPPPTTPTPWAVQERAGAAELCSGKDSGAMVPGARVARSEYAERHPEEVAKFLAVYLRAWSWMHANRSDALALMRKFYRQGGVDITDASLHQEFASRPTFDLAQQLARMERQRGNANVSDMDAWFGQIAEFMRGTGAIHTVPPSSEYITDAYMKRVDADPRLREFANRTR